MLKVRKSNLERLGYSVLTATNASIALAILEQTSISAVLLQYTADGIDAEAVACHIKRRFPRQPIILLSAYSDMPQRILWLVDEHILKSEYPHRLGPAIQRVTAANAA
jgi:CheY-like chemotaxis protein